MEHFQNLLLVVNPISGDTDKHDLIRRVEVQATQRDLRLETYQTTGADDLEKITELLNRYEAHRVLVAGGDGTVQLIAEVLSGQRIPVGILPTGSANGLAVNLGISEALNEALEVALGDQLRDIDAICINNDLCLHMSDLGINAELVKHYEAGSVRGKLGYALQTIPTLIQSDMPFSFEVEANERTLRQDGIMLAIANAQQYGTRATINPQGKLDDGRFEVLIFKKFDILEIFKTLRNEVALDADFVDSVSTTQAQIRCQQPVPFQIDGEYYGEVEHLDVSILPKHLRVVVG